MKKDEIKLVMQWCLPLDTTSEKLDELVETFANEHKEVINYSQCCTQLKDKKALTFDEFKDEFYYKAQMGIYESKASGMFYNLNDLKKRHQKYCLRF